MSERRLPQLSVSVALQSRCNLIYLRHRSSSELHHAELLECFLGAHPVFDGPPHQILLCTFSRALRNTSSSAARGITHTPSRSPKTISPGITLTPPISSGTRKSMTFPRGRLILGVSSVGEGGKTKLEDPARVAVVAIHDRSGGPKLYGPRTHELTPKCILRRSATTDVDLSGL